MIDSGGACRRNSAAFDECRKHLGPRHQPQSCPEAIINKGWLADAGGVPISDRQELAQIIAQMIAAGAKRSKLPGLTSLTGAKLATLKIVFSASKAATKRRNLPSSRDRLV
jgi:hypothetical protein